MSTPIPDPQSEATPTLLVALPNVMSGDNAVFAHPYSWPMWARTARIVGAYFAPGNDDIDERLDALAAQNVSVIIADSPLGQQYWAWVDDDKFREVKAVYATLVQKAHERGLRIVMYHTGLELLSDPPRNPGDEHPEWAQRGLNGTPLLFNDITKSEEHWLNKGIWDLWVSPCNEPLAGKNNFRQLALSRIGEIAETGIDGLWVDEVYLQSSVGSHDDLWPSSDPCSASAFTSATGLAMPAREDWDDPTFRQWIVWRHSQIVNFLVEEKAVARSVNPDIVFFNENSSVDSGRSTYVAADPAALLPYKDMSTGHEIETIADRMDEGETGMYDATLDDWLSFRTMVAFARATDRGKPSWILTYGYGVRDSAQLAGLVLAEGANFYETKGPQMADTVGEPFRTQLFGWIATHETELYTGQSAAEVALLYSPRTRDLVDTVSGEPYDVADSIHFASYRATANLLYRAHIPFDIVVDTDTDMFSRYCVLITPELQVMSEKTATALEHFTGTLITIGDTGIYDEWLQPRTSEAISSSSTHHIDKVTGQVAEMANTGFLSTSLPASVQIGIHQGANGYLFVIVNTGKEPTPKGIVELRLDIPVSGSLAHLSTLDGKEMDIRVRSAPSTVRLSLPAGIDTVALLRLSLEKVASEPSRLMLPLAVHQN